MAAFSPQSFRQQVYHDTPLRLARIAPSGGNDLATAVRHDCRRYRMPSASRSSLKTATAIALKRGDLADALNWPPASDKFRLLAGVFLALFAAYGVTDLAVAAARGWPGGFGDSFALWSFGRFLGDHAAVT